MQVGNLSEHMEKMAPFAQAIVALVLSLALIDKWRERKNGSGPKSSEVAVLASEFKELKSTLHAWMEESKADRRQKWEMLHQVDKRLAIVENRCATIGELKGHSI